MILNESSSSRMCKGVDSWFEVGAALAVSVRNAVRASLENCMIVVVKEVLEEAVIEE